MAWYAGSLTDADIVQREQTIAQLRMTHFTYAGVMEQISLFMMGRGSDLMCEALPSSTRDA